MKRNFIRVLLLLFPCILFTQSYSLSLAKSYDYGVFIGLSPDYISILTKYKEVVIDGYYHSKEQIDYLHNNGVKVYSYLNIGSLEEFRPYYDNFKTITLSEYDNWNDERWIDVSNTKWQSYVVNTLAKNLYSKGIDGLFIDNVDVYSMYKNTKTFEGIHTILRDLKSEYNKPIILNGGYDFINTAMDENLDLHSLINGINLEEVYTHIDDYQNNVFTRKSITSIYFTVKYLKSLKEKGFDIYIIEYSKDRVLNVEIMKTYRKYNFKYFISRKVAL